MATNDEYLRLYREEALPAFKEHDGFVRALVLVDRGANEAISILIFTAAARSSRTSRPGSKRSARRPTAPWPSGGGFLVATKGGTTESQFHKRRFLNSLVPCSFCRGFPDFLVSLPVSLSKYHEMLGSLTLETGAAASVSLS